jgi:hypothetical protein
MTLPRALFALAAAPVVLAAPAIAQDDAKALFQTRYDALRTAMQTRDEAALAAIYAPDFAMTDIRGETRPRGDMRGPGGRMGGPGGRPRPDGAPPRGSRPDGPRPERSITQIVLSASIAGPVATVEQQLVMSGKREGDDGAMHTMGMTTKTTDMWVQMDGVWRLKSSRQTAMTVERDGDVVFSEGK